MSEYKVVKDNYEDRFSDLFAARRKRDNKWQGNAKIYKKENGQWIEVS